jgi:hypothetical protein
MVRESQPAMKVWSAAQLEQFLNLTSDSRYHPAWTMLATTGMRRGEALGLAWADVDLESRKASIRRVRIVVIDAAQTGPTKTGKSRSIELDARTIATLRAWKARQLRERLLMGVGYNDEGYVFTHPDGQPYHPKRFSREFDRAIARYGLDRVRLHDLRHTWATLALEAGVHPKIVSEHLDHSSTTITLDTYSHVTQAMASDAAERTVNETARRFVFAVVTDALNRHRLLREHPIEEVLADPDNAGEWADEAVVNRELMRAILENEDDARATIVQLADFVAVLLENIAEPSGADPLVHLQRMAIALEGRPQDPPVT